MRKEHSMNRFGHRRPALLFVLLLAALASACGEPSPSLQRRGDRPSAHEINRRLREMQRVQLADGTTMEVNDDGSGAQNLEDLVRADCVDIVKSEVDPVSESPLLGCTGSDFDSPSTCNQEICSSQLHLCVSALLLDIADTPVTFELGTVQIPPQRRSTTAAIRETAALYAREATLIAGNALRRTQSATGAQGGCTDLQTLQLAQAGVEDMSLAEVLAETLGQAGRVASNATDDAAADTQAVADALPAMMSTYTVGHWAQWYGETLSYLHLANLYVDVQVPPEEILDGVDPPCSSWGADTDNVIPNRAIDLLHNAAMRPDLLRDLSISTDALWTGTGLSDPGGLRERFYERTGDPMFSPTTAMTLTEFYDVSGLTGGELNAARVRVADVAEDVSPAPMATFTPLFVASSTNNYYAATSRPAAARGEALAARLAAGLAGTDMHARATAEGGDGSRPTMAYARASQANFVDWVATVSSELVGALGPTHALVAYIAPTAGALDDVRIGRINPWYRNEAGNRKVELFLYGDHDASDLIVVTGAADASCATDGHVNGEDCTFIARSPVAPTPEVQPAPASYGFREWLEIELHNLPDDSIYVLQRRDGALSSGPGDYELIQAMELDWASAKTSWRTATYPIVPFLTEQAEQALTSSTESCDQAEVSCTGLLRNTRIPLENSLADDGDAWESSWRHYLVLARQAANTADDLGQAWIDVGYTIDDRSEQAWNDVEDECGDIGELANETDLFAQPGTSCPSEANCDAERGERCVNGVCLVTPVGRVADLSDEDPRAARVAECLGLDGAAYVPFATLGARPLCMWFDPEDETYCKDFPGAPSCPYPMQDPEDPSPCLAGPDGSVVTLPEMDWTFVEVTDTLGISADEYDGTNEAGDVVDTCNYIRRAAFGSDGITATEIAQRIRDRFSLEELQQVANRLGWVAEPLNLSHLTLDRSPWYPRVASRWRGPQEPG